MTRRIVPVVEYGATAVLDMDQLAAALQCSRSTLEKMDLPIFYLNNSPRLPRAIWGQVLDVLRTRAEGRAA